jgi:hypothetical protein
MTCSICEGKGYYYIDDYNSDGHVKLFFNCPYCEHEKIDGEDVMIEARHSELDFEERVDINRRDDIGY